MAYQDTNCKIYLSLFGWKVNILDKMHIVHCIRAQGSTLGQVLIMISGLGAHGRLHSLLWLDVLEDLEGALDIHQRPAQQKGGIETSPLAC